MNESKNYWNNHECDFFKELDKWLKATNKRLEMDETNPAGEILKDFLYHIDNSALRSNDHYRVFDEWIDKNRDNHLFWSDGYDNFLEKWKETLVDLRYCKKSELGMEDENIVKRTCKELGITQKELAERLEVPQPTMARWATGEVPEQSKKLLELFLENTKLKEDLRDAAKALKILDKIKGYE